MLINDALPFQLVNMNNEHSIQNDDDDNDDDEDDDDDDDVDDVDDFCDVDDDGAHDDDFDSSSKCVIVITSLWSITYARFLAWNLTMTCCVWYMREYQDEETHEDTS